MHVLGKPVRVCPEHVAVLTCKHRCLGVKLGEVEELQAATHPGCAVCQRPPRRSRPTFRILRKCPDCYSRFRVSAYDDSFADEWIAAARTRLSAVVSVPVGIVAAAVARLSAVVYVPVGIVAAAVRFVRSRAFPSSRKES